VAPAAEHPVLIANRLADVAFGTGVAGEEAAVPVVTEPVFKYRLVAVAAGQAGQGLPGAPRYPSPGGRPPGTPRDWRWLVGPSGTDPGSATSRLLARLGIPEGNIRVLPSQSAAWSAAADGAGVATAIEHLVSHQVRRGELAFVDIAGVPAEEVWYATTLERDHRSTAAGALRRFLSTPEAMQVIRAPAAGVPPSRFKPPVYVTIWS
jgi:DNA-binding transcriptional LysR family regulator